MPEYKNIQVLFDLALQEMDQARWSEALVHLDQALVVDRVRPGLRFNRAWCRLQLGDLSGAQEDLETLLLLKSDHSQALALLGRVQLARDQLREGAVHLTRAQRLEPDNAWLARQAIQSWLVVPDAVEPLLSCALEVAQRGLLEEADLRQLLPFVHASSGGKAELRAWLIALCQLPQEHLQEWMFEGWCSFCESEHDYVELAVAARMWLERFAASALALDRLILALASRGDLDAAVPLALERARKHPEQAEQTKALVMHLFANKNKVSILAASTLLSHAISRDPKNAMLWCLRGDVNCKFFLTLDAASDYRQALSIDPTNAMARAGLADALAQDGRFDEAMTLLEEHPWAESDRGLVFHTIGAVLRRAGRFEQAREMLEKVWHSTRHPAAAFNLAFCLLALGDYPRGFALFAYRRDTGWANRIGHRAQSMGAKLWRSDLQALVGQLVLVTTENGIGDTFHFARYLPQLMAHAASVTIVAQSRTERLLQSVHPALRVVPDSGHLPLSDWVCDIMDLPELLGARLDMPESLGQAHCINADPEVVQSMRTRLGPVRGLRVALGWTGTRSSMAERSIPLALFAELEWPGVEWFSLQYDDLSPEDQAAAQQMGLRQEKWDFDETAAAMTLMDAVVTIDTVYAHLAGAMGLSPWVLLNAKVDWRWQDMGGANAWYPQARLLRAPAPDDWRTVLAQLQDELSALSSKLLADIPVVDPAPQLGGAEETGPEWFALLNAVAARGDWTGTADAFLRGLRLDDDSLWLIRALEILLPHIDESQALLGPMLGRLLRRWPKNEDVPFDELSAVGMVLLHARRHPEALNMALLGVQKAPHNIRAWGQLALAYKLANDPEGIVRAARRVMALDPACESAQWINQHKMMLSDQLEDVLILAHADCLEARRTGDPKVLIDALLWRCATLKAMTRLDMADLDAREVLSLAPEEPRAHWMLGELLALQGRYVEAAPHVLTRLTIRSAVGGLKRLALDSGVLEWVTGGVSLWQGRHVVVFGNNGAGDTFQFGRFLPYLAKQGLNVTFCFLKHHAVVVPSLLAMSNQAGVQLACVEYADDILPKGADVFVQLESLPWLLGVSPKSLPDWPAEFVHVQPKQQLRLAQRMGWSGTEKKRLRVGLAWLGQSSGEGIRRTELKAVAQAFLAEGLVGCADFYGLPIEDLTEDEKIAAQQLGMVHPQWSFEDEAAALLHMDLVVSIDTAHAHLAGALGVPCWVLLKLVPDWRWGIEGERTPWYPNARLFRQEQANDWHHPVQEVAKALHQMAQNTGHWR